MNACSRSSCWKPVSVATSTNTQMYNVVTSWMPLSQGQLLTFSRTCNEYSDIHSCCFSCRYHNPRCASPTSVLLEHGTDLMPRAFDKIYSPLCSSTDFDEASVDWLQDLYGGTMSTLLDQHAPRRVVCRRHQPSTTWFDGECAAAKCRARVTLLSSAHICRPLHIDHWIPS